MDTADGKAENSELQKAADEITDALTGRELDLVHGGVGHERWTECLAGHGGRLPHMETAENEKANSGSPIGPIIRVPAKTQESWGQLPPPQTSKLWGDPPAFSDNLLLCMQFSRSFR